MKDHCLELVRKQSDPSVKYNVMREYAQAYVLKLMQEAGALQSYAFLGGTALRFLYDLPRFSEDLDFSLSRPAALSFVDLMTRIKKDLALAGYSAGVSYNDEKTVHSAFIKFEGLMFEAGLSPMKSQKFSIKIDVDTRPPQGAVGSQRHVHGADGLLVLQDVADDGGVGVGPDPELGELEGVGPVGLEEVAQALDDRDRGVELVAGDFEERGLELVGLDEPGVRLA